MPDPEGFIAEEPQGFVSDEPSALGKAIRSAASAFSGGVLGPQTTAMQQVPQEFQAISDFPGKASEALLRTTRDIVSPTTYLPEEEQAKLRPFKISDEGIMPQTKEEADPIKAGKPLFQFQRTTLQPEPNPLQSLIESSTTPESLLTLPFAETAAGRLYFASQGAGGAAGAAASLLDQTVDPETRRKAIEALPLSAAMILHGLKGTPPAAVTEGETPAASAVSSAQGGEAVTSPTKPATPESNVTGGVAQVVAATHTDPETGITTTGANHPQAREAQGVEPGTRKSREKGDDGFLVQSPGIKSISYETYDEPTGEWKGEKRQIVVSRSTIPGDKPWRATVFAGPKEDPVAIAHIQIDSPTDLSKPEAVGALGEQLGRYTRKINIREQSPEVVSRKEGEAVAQESGQALPKKGDQIHSDEVKSPVDPTKPLSEVPQQPQFVSMGNAVLGEFDRKGSPTAMKYRLIDQERQQRGLEPLTKPEGTSDQATLDKAMETIDRDPELPDRLVAELNNKPRAIEDWENHVLMLRKIDLRNEFEKSANEAAQAYDDSKQFPQRKEDMQRANTRTAELSNKLEDLERASRVSGSARGRALRSLQVMLNEDYSLAGLERKKRAAKGGEPLTDRERSELVRVSKQLQELQKSLVERESGESERRVAAVSKALAEDAAKRPAISPAILKVANQLVSAIDTRADAARLRLKARAGRFSAGVDPTVLVDLAEIGMSHLAHAGIDFAEWSSRMISEVGEWARPHLKEVFERSQKGIDALGKASGAPRKAVSAVKGGFKALDLEGKKAETVKAIRKAVEENSREGIGYYAQRIARAFVERGVNDTQKLVDSVHEVMREAIPELTRREAMDAISGYGDYKQLSKDEITVKLRGMKGELQQLAKLEDMASGQPPLKSGLERRTPTEAETKLIKEVNEAKRKFQIPISDPETQLKSSLDTLKKGLETRIKNYEERISKGDYEKTPKRSITLDKPALELKDKAEKLRNEFEKGLIKDRLAKRSVWSKMADMAVQWSRIAKLASLKVYPKLLSAATFRSVFEPASRATGQPLRLIAPDVYEKSRMESGMSIRSEAKYWATALTSWGKAWEKLRTGSTDIDRLTQGNRIKPDMEMLNFVGNSHGMFKEPIRQASFQRALQLGYEAARKAGENPDDPLVTTQIMSQAAEHANRNIFMQPNMITRYLVKVPIGALKANPFKGAAALGRTLEFLMPIVNVPSNIAAHTMRLNPAVGFTEAALRLRDVRKTGVLTTADAEAISRAFKLGSLGTLLAAYAWNNPEEFGGVYDEHRRKGAGLKTGEVSLMGVKIPAFMTHAPELMWLNTVASARRVRDRYVQTHGPGAGSPDIDAMWFMTLSPVKNFPVIDTYIRAFSENRSLGRTAGALVRDSAIPGVVTSTLNSMDTTKRTPQGFVDELKMGVPGLRQEVPRSRNQ